MNVTAEWAAAEQRSDMRGRAATTRGPDALHSTGDLGATFDCRRLAQRMPNSARRLLVWKCIDALNFSQLLVPTRQPDASAVPRDRLHDQVGGVKSPAVCQSVPIMLTAAPAD